ncbi:MAG TPA: winged helix-turn-helix domain-containing protein, partial [Spongiibacteraceae bacterium]|nr:winged helix-turn-helix domain-containing protein [Spongiibacteraceae bacterium]
IRALLRRASGQASPEIHYGALLLNPLTHQVSMAGQSLELSAREFALLYALMSPPGAVVSRETLMDKLYSWSEEVESNTIEVYIHQLRKKLGSEAIRTIRGVGYMLIALEKNNEARA